MFVICKFGLVIGILLRLLGVCVVYDFGCVLYGVWVGDCVWFKCFGDCSGLVLVWVFVGRLCCGVSVGFIVAVDLGLLQVCVANVFVLVLNAACGFDG